MTVRPIRSQAAQQDNVASNPRFFLGARPSFELLFTRDRVFDVAEALEVDEAVTVIRACEAVDQVTLVLPDAVVQVVAGRGPLMRGVPLPCRFRSAVSCSTIARLSPR